MRILYLWLYLCVCGLWSHTALADRLFVYAKNEKEFLAIDSLKQITYIPSNTAYISATDDLYFYALEDINASISRGELFVQFDGLGKDYVTNRFYEFWDYVNSNYSANTVYALEFQYFDLPIESAMVMMGQPVPQGSLTNNSTFTITDGSILEFPWTYFDGNTNQTIYVKPRRVSNWDWTNPARLKLTVEGRIPDSDASFDPYANEFRENFGSMYQISFMDYPYRYDATVNPTPRTPERWSDAKLITMAKRNPTALTGSLIAPSALTNEFWEHYIMPDTQIANLFPEVWANPEGSMPDNSVLGVDGNAGAGIVLGTDTSRDATLLDVVDAIKDLALEVPEAEWSGIEADAVYDDFYEFESTEWLPDDVDIGSGNINVPTAYNGASLPSYLTIGEYSIPLGAMFATSPMAELCQWAKLLFEMGIYFGFAFIVINDVRQLIIGASNQTQVSGNTELHGGVVFAEVSSRMPSVLTNHLMIMGALLALSGALLGVASSGIVPNWNFTQVVQDVFNASPYIIQLAFGFIDPFFPTELMASMTVGLLAFKVLSLTTYGIATLAIKSASA